MNKIHGSHKKIVYHHSWVMQYWGLLRERMLVSVVAYVLSSSQNFTSRLHSSAAVILECTFQIPEGKGASAGK
jgi:hypothetical protein